MTISHQINHIHKETEVMRTREIWHTNIHTAGVAEGERERNRKCISACLELRVLKKE